MNKYKDLKKKSDSAFNEINTSLNDMNVLAETSKRASTTAKNAHIIINDIDRQFSQVTKLNNVDISFLFLATALQCVRQYLLTNFETRVSDKEAAKNTQGKTMEHSNRGNILYCPNINEIVTNPVPFDAIYGSKAFDLGLSGNTHRAKTLGHDPVLGWVFGTNNILTSTMTLHDFRSFHVTTDFVPTGPSKTLSARDKIVSPASTSKVIKYSMERLFRGGTEGVTATGCALVKEAIHLKSDVNSKMSLPLPLVSSLVSPEFALKIGEYGLDVANVNAVGKQASYSVLINTMIAMMHRLFYDESIELSEKYYEVRTRKILSYSNAMASSSNLIYVALSKDVSKLDVGGLAVTLYRLVSDGRFISQLKREFLEKEFYNAVLENVYEK